MKNEVIRANTGKATHLGFYHVGQGLGVKKVIYYPPCGSFSSGNTTNEIVTGLDVTLENITCKRCKKILEETFQAKKDVKIAREKKGLSAIELIKKSDDEVFFFEMN